MCIEMNGICLRWDGDREQVGAGERVVFDEDNGPDQKSDIGLIDGDCQLRAEAALLSYLSGLRWNADCLEVSAGVECGISDGGHGPDDGKDNQ
jgi:hypothetical protein